MDARLFTQGGEIPSRGRADERARAGPWKVIVARFGNTQHVEVERPLHEVGRPETAIAFVFDESGQAQPAPASPPIELDAPPAEDEDIAAVTPAGLSPRYSFDTFIVPDMT